MTARSEIITYWLCPADPARNQFAAIISDLAMRFDAPVFEPHVTIHVTSAASENPAAVLEKALNGHGEYRLAVQSLDYSDEFTKTLFVQFAGDPDLARLSENLRCASGLPSDYKLNPHLSLIYTEMEHETKRSLAASITLSFTDVAFDRVKAIISPAEIKSRADVEAWRVVAEQSLVR